MRYILRIFRRIFKWMPFSAIMTAVDYLCGALIPAAITVVSVGLFDTAARVLQGKPLQSGLYLYAGWYLGIFLVNDLFSFIRSITLNAGIYEKGTAFFRMDLYEKLAQLPLISFESAELLDKKERAEKAVHDETLSEIFNHTMRFIRSGIRIVSVAAVLAGYSLWLLPLSLLSVAPYLIARVIRGKEFFYVKSHQAKKTRRLSYLWDLFTARHPAKEMRVMGFAGYITDQWRTARDEVNEELWKVQKKDAVSLLWCDGCRIAGYGISVVVVLALALRGEASIGVFGAAIPAFLSLQHGMQEFLQRLGGLHEELLHAADYYSFLDMPKEADGGVPYPGLQKTVELENVRFKYPNGGEDTLKAVDLILRKGEKVAVLGENGSGKTTLVKVLLGLYPATGGRVLYDGTAIGDFSKDSFYARVSAIAQDFVSYSLTLRENVALSDLPRMGSDGAIKEALADAGIDTDTGLPLDGMMGREFGGMELSGGQWQKLAIARGMFRDSELIVLDEPTSALDPLIETEILTKFIKASEGKTALIISHRVGLCKLVDRIIVMREGRIVEDGTHEALLAAGGAYALLYGAQAKWYTMPSADGGG